jgi:putative transcriptional regulator
MVENQFKSDLDEAIHCAASGLYRAGVIGEKTMGEYGRLRTKAAPDLAPKEITHVGNAIQGSQGDLDR